MQLQPRIHKLHLPSSRRQSTNDDLSDQIEALFGQAQEELNGSSPVSTESTHTNSDVNSVTTLPPGKAEESLDQIDHMLSQQADQSLDAEFEDVEDLVDQEAAAVEIDSDTLLADDQEEDLSELIDQELLCADDTALGHNKASTEEPVSAPQEFPDIQSVDQVDDVEPQTSVVDTKATQPQTLVQRRVRVLSILLKIGRGLESLLMLILRMLNRPLARLSPETRDTIGYLPFYTFSLDRCCCYGMS